MRIRPLQLAILVAACAAAALAVAAGGSRAGDRPVRTVVVTMHHSRFEPALLRVEPGERVRFVLRNTDPIDHEFILGDDAVQQIHELGTEAVHPPKPGEVSVPAGTTATTTYTFGQPGELTFACHLPGHFAYGMHGTVTVG